MKTKSFKAYLEKRLNKEEIAQIKEQAEREVRIQKGEANLRLSSIAHLFALMDKTPKDNFRK